MDRGEVPGYEFEAPRGSRHGTGHDPLRQFRHAAPPAPPAPPAPSRRPPARTAGPAGRAAGGVLAVMRGKNWLLGLALPILVAVVVGIAVVVTAGGGAGGGAAPSALAAGFPPARQAGQAFTGPAGATRVVLAAIAASAGTEVVAGSANDGPALWVSADGGTAWTRAALTGRTALARAGSGQLAGVAHGTAGWLAVGTSLAGAGGPLIASSPDARTWALTGGTAALGAAAAGAVAAAVAAGPAGFVIVGHQAAGGAATAAAWYAPGLDRAGWRRAAVTPGKTGPGKAGQTLMNAVTATAHGFAAVGAAAARPAAWLSADGRTWRREVLTAPGGAARAALDYVAASGAELVAAGTAFSAAGTGSPFTEISADSGATWTLVRLSVPGGSRQPSGVTALTAAGGGFTAAGTYSTPAGPEVAIWTLQAGAGAAAGWMVAAPLGTGLAGPATQNAITALTADGATLTGAGYTEAAATAGRQPGQQTEQRPTLWQSPIR